MIPITTNKIAHERGMQDERKRTFYAFEAHKAMLQDRIKATQSLAVKQAFALAIIELSELQKTLEPK
jgi:hypothetical protein